MRERGREGVLKCVCLQVEGDVTLVAVVRTQEKVSTAIRRKFTCAE